MISLLTFALILAVIGDLTNVYRSIYAKPFKGLVIVVCVLIVFEAVKLLIERMQ